MAYSNNNYKKYTPKLITPPQGVPEISAIQEIQPIEPVKPVYGITSLTDKERTYNQAKQNKQLKTFLANYNDPTELNSFIDALTNREAVSKEFGDAWGAISTTSGQVSVATGIASAVLSAVSWIISAVVPGDFGAIGAVGTAATTASKATKIAATAAKTAQVLDKISKIAAIPAVPAAAKVAYDYSIKPVMHGKPKEALVNTLINIGETADAAANPIKGLVLEGGEGFIKASGLSDAGRFNYDYDTGFFLADMLLEVVSDPFNWTQWATSGAKSAAIKRVSARTAPVAQQTVDAFLKLGQEQLPDLFKEISEETHTKLIKTLNNSLVETALSLGQQSVHHLTDAAKNELLRKSRKKIQRVLTRAIKKALPQMSNEQLQLLLKNAPKHLKETVHMENIFTQLFKNITWDTLAVDTIKELSQITHYAQAFEKRLIKGALMTTGYGAFGAGVIKLLDPVKQWAQAQVLKPMRKYMASTDVLRLAQYAEAKAEWQARKQYTTLVAGEAVTKNIDNFYRWNTVQFNQDKQLIETIMTDASLEPSVRKETLNNAFIASRQTTFDVYLEQLNDINELENGLYTSFLKYGLEQKQLLEHEINAAKQNIKLKSAAQLLHTKNAQALATKQSKLFKKLTNLTTEKLSNTKTLADTVYTFKVNNAEVNQLLLSNDKIRTTMSKINSGRINNLFEQIIASTDARAANANANILGNIINIKNAAIRYSAVNNFHNTVVNMLLPTFEGIDDAQLRRAILDQVAGMADREIGVLLADFDGITINELLQRLNTVFYDKGIDLSQSLELRQQLKKVVKTYLEEQYENGVLYTNVALEREFTTYVRRLYNSLPDWQKELTELYEVNPEIHRLFNSVNDMNSMLLQNILTDKTSLLDTISIRGLTDLGLAATIVADADSLKWFNLPATELSGHVTKAAAEIGQKLNQIIKHVEQYNTLFKSKTKQEQLNRIYQHFVKRFLDFNTDYTLDAAKSADANRLYWGSFKTTAFHYIKDATTPVEQLAQLIMFNQTQIKNMAGKQFNIFLSECTDKDLVRLIRSPKKVLNTEWVKDGVNYTPVNQINEEYLHLVDAYDQFTLETDKLIRDFTQITDDMEDTLFNMPKRVTQTRYIKALKNTNDSLRAFQKYYDTLFDSEMANQLKEKYSTFLINHPDFAQQRINWSEEIEQAIKNGTDTLDAHPTHEEVFNKLIHYWEGYWIPTQASADVLNGIAEVDEFTPFYKLVQEFNNDLQAYVSNNNSEAFDTFRERIQDITLKRAQTWEEFKQIRKDNNLEHYYTYLINKENEKEVTHALIKERDEKLKAKLKQYNTWDRERIKKEMQDKLMHLKLTPEYANMKKELQEAYKEIWTGSQFSKEKQAAYTMFKEKQRKISRAAFKELNQVQYEALTRLKKSFQQHVAEEYRTNVERLYRRCFTKEWKGWALQQDPVIELYKRINKQYTGVADSGIPSSKAAQQLALNKMERAIYHYVGRATPTAQARATKIKHAAEAKYKAVKAEYLKIINETDPKNRGTINKAKARLDDALAARNLAIEKEALAYNGTETQKAVSTYFNTIARLNGGLGGSEYVRKMRAWGKLELDKIDYKILNKSPLSSEAINILREQAKYASYYEQEAREFALQIRAEYLDAYNNFKHQWSWDNVENQFIYQEDVERLRLLQEHAYQTIFKDYINVREFLYKTYIWNPQLEGDDIFVVNKSMLGEALDKNFKNYIELVRAGHESRWEEFRKINREHLNKYINDRYKDNDTLRKLYKEDLETLDLEFEEAYKDYQKSKLLYEDPLDIFAPTTKQRELNSMIKQASEANARGTLYNIFNYDETQLINHLATNHRILTFTSRSFNDNYIAHAYGAFKERMQHAPVKFFEEDLIDEFSQTPIKRYWIVLDKNQKIGVSNGQVYLNPETTSRPIIRDISVPQFNEFQIIDELITDENAKQVTKMLSTLNEQVSTLTGATLNTSQGEYFTKEHLEYLYQHAPEEVQKALPPLEELLDKQFFNCHFNETVLGIAQDKRDLGFYSSNMINNAKNAITGAGIYAKAKTEYINLMLDPQQSIAEGIFKHLSDNDLLNALQQTGEYKLVILVHDKRYGMRLKEILPLSVKDISKARKMGATIVSLQTFKDMYGKINLRIGSMDELKWWSRLIFMYKTGYLINPGTMIRNFIDTNLKSYLEMRGEYKEYKAQAHKILDECDRIKNYIQQRSRDGLITREAIQEYFDTGCAKNITLEQFDELQQLYFSQGVSGNIMADLYQTDPTQRTLWDTYTNVVGKVIDEGRIPYKRNEFGELTGPKLLPGNRTENYNRLAVYLYELDHGASQTNALAKLSKIHFDYSFKTRSEQILELIFPFTTFMLRNYSYWVEVITKHPWIARNYVHLMKPSWDFQEYTPEEIARNRALQNQILAGHIKLGEYKNTQLAFKANPSIQNALTFMSNPVEAIYNNLAAPLESAIKVAQRSANVDTFTNALPIIGPMAYSAKKAVTTKNPLPSVFNTRKDYKFTNKNLSKINAFRDSNYKVPKYRNNIVFDSYKTIGTQRYRLNMYPVIDIAHDVKSKYTVDVYNRIKNKVQTDVYKGIRYRLKLDVNRFR